MRIGIGAPTRGTPGTGTDAVINLFKGDPWLATKPDGRPAERIATEWGWDEAGTSLRLKIRRDVHFHDGTLLTPEIAAQALRASVADVRNRPFSFTSVSSVDAAGDDTINIRLKERNGFVPSDLAAILVEKPGRPDIGTGPFQVVSRQNKDAKLTAFPRHYRGRPALAGVDVASYPTQRNAWTALMRGEVDMLYEVSRDAADFIRAETTVNTYSFPRPYYIPLVFNVRHPILKNVQVRQALNEALDRESLVRDGMSGRGSPADGPVWPQHWAYSAPSAPLAFDPVSARRRLDAAGFPARATREGPVPVRFSFSCLVFGSDSRYERMAVLMQKQLADVGVDMQLVSLPLDQLGPRMQQGDFDAFLIEMAGRSLSWVYEFWRSHENMRFDSGYRSADAVLDKIRNGRTDEEVRAAVAELTRVFHDDPPAAFLVWQETSRAVSTKFDVSPEEKRDPVSNLWLWRPAAAATRASR